ncbi:MAG: TonB-dependent receptor [Acidobacteriota bacterium]
MNHSGTFARTLTIALLFSGPILFRSSAAADESIRAGQTQPSTSLGQTEPAATNDGQGKGGVVIPNPVEVVVTATRTELPTREVASSTTVISSAEIDQKQANSVVEALRNVPALDVVQSGGPGHHASVFIRGAQPEHTLMLIDGIEMNDPSSAGRTYDFEQLTTDDVDQIEIIRGPQSTLYGSDAIGGVINIITRKGDGPMSSSVSAEAGSFDTFREKLRVSGSSGAFNYSLGVSRTDSQGISAADESLGNPEKDGLGNTSVSTRLGLSAAANLDLDVFAGLTDATTDVDTYGGSGGDDPNSFVYYRQWYLRTQGTLRLAGGTWEQKFGVSVSEHFRHYYDDVDAQHPYDRNDTTFSGRIIKADWQSNLYSRDINTMTIGVESEDERGRSHYYSESIWGPYSSTFDAVSARTSGVFVQDQVKVCGAWLTTLGARLDDHSEFGSKLTYRIASAYLIPAWDSKIKGTFGTGFKAPSLYQLYSQYGDTSLKPESSMGWDIGFEQYLLHETLAAGATYFRNRFTNLIEYDSATSKYGNVLQADASGVEIFASVDPGEKLSFRASYTLTDTRDGSTGRPLIRRPRHKFGFDVNSRLNQRASIHVSLIHVGEREDNDSSTWPSIPVTMDAYTIVNVAAKYRIGRNIRLFGRIDNLFNSEYEEVYGYGSPGISASCGVGLAF